MIATAVALAFGVGVGALFAVFGNPVPAPATITGSAGVVGITLGGLLVHWWR